MFKISKRKQNFKGQYFFVEREFFKKNIRFKKQNTLDPYLCFIACIKMLSSPARVPFITYTSKYTQDSYTYLNFYDCMYLCIHMLVFVLWSV